MSARDLAFASYSIGLIVGIGVVLVSVYGRGWVRRYSTVVCFLAAVAATQFVLWLASW